MMQSRLMSLIEALANVGVGYGVAVTTQIAVFPLFGLTATLAENLLLGAVFTVVSIIRSYTLRRLWRSGNQGVIKRDTGSGPLASDGERQPGLSRCGAQIHAAHPFSDWHQSH
jgi:hypothetical protein